MTAPAIARLDARLLVIPLLRPWGVDVTDIRVIVVTVWAEDGAIGNGFTWTPTIGAEAVLAILQHDIAPFVVGRPAEPELWQTVWERLHEAGSGGVTSIAMAGLDLALWDLRSRRRELSLVDLLGRQHEWQPVYASGVNRHYSEHDLQAQLERWVAAGYRAAKIKVGGGELARDLDRVAMAREILGPDRELMIDANQLWDLDAATRAAEALAGHGISWLEEPLRADDTAGYAELRKRAPMPLALGENAHTIYRFRDLIDAGACDIIQPNIVRVGGLTPFLEIAQLARDAGVKLGPHLLPELSGQVALTLPEPTWVEDVEDAGFEQLGALAAPSGMRISDGRISGGERIGLGLEFVGSTRDR